MKEIFENIRQEVKELAETAWGLACAQKQPLDAAEFLDNVLRYYDHTYTEEEIEFLRFYFNMKMEMMKND